MTRFLLILSEVNIGINLYLHYQHYLSFGNKLKIYLEKYWPEKVKDDKNNIFLVIKL